jgi:hypothetical protein
VGKGSLNPKICDGQDDVEHIYVPVPVPVPVPEAKVTISGTGTGRGTGVAVMSERGFADLLGIDHETLRSMAGTWPPKMLEPFWDKDLTMTVTLAVVEAEKSPYKGRKIVVYDAKTMEEIIRTYSLAYAHDGLREHQLHIGERSSILVNIFVKTALHVIIEDS